MTITLLFCTATCNMAFMLFVLLAGPVSGDLSVGFAASALVALPTDLMAFYFMHKVGRKWTTATAALMVAALTLPHGFLPNAFPSWTLTLSVFMGKCLNNVASIVINVIISEVYPTNIRATFAGLAMQVSCLAQVAAPYLAHATQTYFIIGLLATCFGIMLLLFVPETSGREMPENIQDMLDLWKESEKVYRIKSVEKESLLDDIE